MTTSPYKQYKPGTWIAFTHFTPPHPEIRPMPPQKPEDAEERSWLDREAEQYKSPFEHMSKGIMQYNIPVMPYQRQHQLDGLPLLCTSQSGRFLALADMISGISFSINLDFYSVEILEQSYVEWFMHAITVKNSVINPKHPTRYYFANGTETAASVEWQRQIAERQFEIAAQQWLKDKCHGERPSNPGE